MHLRAHHSLALGSDAVGPELTQWACLALRQVSAKQYNTSKKPFPCSRRQASLAPLLVMAYYWWPRGPNFAPVVHVVRRQVKVLHPLDRVRREVERDHGARDVHAPLHVPRQLILVLDAVVVRLIVEVAHGHHEVHGAISVDVGDRGGGKDVRVDADVGAAHVLAAALEIVVDPAAIACSHTAVMQACHL